MPKKELFPHQVEAVDAVVRHLELSATQKMPPEGLRTQVIAATGSGKTLIAVHSAQQLGADRVLVLMPTLDLLAQTVAAWREGGRTGAMIGVCSLRADEAPGFPCTTDVDELVDWTRGLKKVTVFATYAAVGLGTLQRAHAAGLLSWSLIIVDEAHRTSGHGAKPWAAVHDNAKIPADRRLYMTATARVWEAPEAGEGGRTAQQLVASMDPDSPVFGPVAYKLTLSDAIGLGLVAKYQVVCVDVADPSLQAAQLLGMESRSDNVRGTRLAALQTAVLKASAQEKLRRVLTFHHKVSEAEAMAEGVPAVASRLWESDPDFYPVPERVWAAWLCGEHSPGYRRQTLDAFSSDVIEYSQNRWENVPAALRVLSSVRVLGEGVDTKNCDAVTFCDVRGSMVDIVQMVGRALRMKPGEGKVASLVVPVFLAPGESPDEMLTSKAYDGLAKVLAALRSHDSDAVEQLALSQARSRPAGKETGEGEEGAQEGPSAPARELLKFSTPRDPAQLAAFVSLRILRPENTFWRRGIQAATRYVKEYGDLRAPYSFVTPQEWAPAGFPLGTWLTDQRRFFNAGQLDADRAQELDGLGMVWSHFDVAFEEGLTAAKEWAAVHSHLLPPISATWNGYPVGAWVKNQRTAAKLADANAARREEGLEVQSSAGALTQDRRDALEDIDPAWCPAWDTGWQRAYRLSRLRIEAGGTLPLTPGQVTVQGEDLGRWVQAQRLGWDKLATGQQWMLQNMLGLTPAREDEQPVKRTQADKWALNMEAAQQFHAREGHLNVPRKHLEQMDRDEAGVKLGMFIDNTRRRADKLTPERHEALTALDMRWT
ncbi:DEAD/DEAH box helicase [Actinacidiphila soli]|uniref:DEAD/DEAH box helicase n=1 Tax=Actinacidiphila soli TaxID=2487275 RepID=UPI000FCA80A3|nr:DEAD/DEAH box helicase [Actinacidiphila soli]